MKAEILNYIVNIYLSIYNKNKYVSLISDFIGSKISVGQKKKELMTIIQSNVAYMPNSIYHLSAFTYGNTGDFLLVTALEDAIITVLQRPVHWLPENVRNVVDDNMVSVANKMPAVLIGGGGLFLKDTNPNKISGWQWPCSLDMLHKIKVPIFILGVGYNRFRDQDDFDDMFQENINAVVEKSDIFGMRNHGSICELKKYLRADLHDKVIYHPCATTVLSKIYTIPQRRAVGKPVIALNCAFDRENLRYDGKQSDILKSIANVMKKLSSFCDIKIFLHTKSDNKICPYLDEVYLSYEIVVLHKKMQVDELLFEYTNIDLMIGMRGHAQLIPFGCRTPILSLISHDKMQWFLDDIGHSEWGVEISDPALEDLLFEKAMSILKNKDEIIDQIDAAQDKLWAIVTENIRTMDSIIIQRSKGK